jgi:acetolactate synthase small subunit
MLTILSEDKKGLVSINTNMLNRRGIEIVSISTTMMGIYSQVLVTFEVIAEPAEVKAMTLKIQNIIEVHQVSAAIPLKTLKEDQSSGITWLHNS